MAETNIDEFDKAVGLILAKLYQSFPMRILIEPIITESLSPFDPTIDGWDKPYFRQRDIFKCTMSWLIQAGYIWSEKQDGLAELSGIFKECVLSAKGLEVLKAPDSLSGLSIGAQLQDAARDGVLSSIKSLTEKALGIGAKMGYSAAVVWASS
ncbi:hypothetical protein [Pseudomonas sp. SJZ131]|uniref:hypothetical protein n=1 Tax=Pseudomonas sp. SJZ131 TaxID=2572895 RepID=UPI00119B262F|nr:hypothetical protein [Pseudomonas sp. SJZ131]TWD52523.1 hypothetical protein FBY12_1049 [Pseudomonas sp. SJZ131]